MANASKKEQAFKLFAQGKKPGDPEIRALGLSPKTANKYQTLFRKQQDSKEEPTCRECAEAAAGTAAEIPAAEAAQAAEVILGAPGEVPVASIPDGYLFEAKGLLYKKIRQVYSGQVIARRMIGTGYSTSLKETGSAEFKPGTMVIAK